MMIYNQTAMAIPNHMESRCCRRLILTNFSFQGIIALNEFWKLLEGVLLV